MTLRQQYEAETGTTWWDVYKGISFTSAAYRDWLEARASERVVPTVPDAEAQLRREAEHLVLMIRGDGHLRLSDGAAIHDIIRLARLTADKAVADRNAELLALVDAEIPKVEALSLLINGFTNEVRLHKLDLLHLFRYWLTSEA